MSTKSAGIYVRISQDRGGAGLGVERQEQECRALAAAAGLDGGRRLLATTTFARTAASGDPDYERMLADIKAGKINAVIAWHPDRLHRRALELERYIDVVRASTASTNQTVTAGHVGPVHAVGPDDRPPARRGRRATSRSTSRSG